MPVDDVAARGFGAGAAAYEARPARLPGRGDRAAGRPRSASARAPRSATWRPAPASSPGGCSSSALASPPSSRSTRCARRPRSAVPGATHVDGTAEAIPLAGRDRSTSSPSPRPSTGSTRRPRSTEIARVLRPGRSPRHPLERARRVHRVGGGDEPDHPLARADGVALPAHRLGRGRRRRAAGSRRCTSRCSRGSSRSPVSCSPTGCGRSATSPRCPPSSASGTSPRSSRSSPAARSRSRCRTCAACSGASGPDRPAGRRPRLVGGAAPRPAVAADARPVGGAGLRGDGPADAGRAGRRAVAAVPRPVPDAGGARRRAGRRGRPLVVRARVQPPRPRPAPHRAGRGRATTAVGCPADLDALLALPGHRPVHRAGRARLRLRGRPRRRRHQHGAGAGPLGGSPPRAPRRCRRPPTRPSRPGRRGRGTRRCSTSAPPCAPDARPRCDGCPVAGRLRVGAEPAAPSPIRPTARPGVSRWPVALRGQRPPGPRPPGRGAAARDRSRPASWPR